MAPSNLQAGSLDGYGILRFAHSFESGGGTERYLDDLDHSLLEQNAMTIVRLHLTRNPRRVGPVRKSIGRGLLVCVGLPVVPGSECQENQGASRIRRRINQLARDHILYNPIIWQLIGKNWTKSRPLRSWSRQALGAAAATLEALQSQHLDLAVLHHCGGLDADEVITELRDARVPFAVVNHFSNERFRHLSVRKHVMLAAGVASVSGIGIPTYLRGRVTNVSDGIDTHFFSRAEAHPLARPPTEPVLLLPARIVREKGQIDLIRAAAALRSGGVNCCAALAGRVDSDAFAHELRRVIVTHNLTDHVHLLGNLSPAELRDWYAASTVLVLPTYHDEGLPRIILEALAMELPVTAYATGGIADGVADNVTGFLLKTGDLTGLTARLRDLLLSSPLRSALGAAARHVAETQFSLHQLANRHTTFYASLISESRRSRPKAASDGIRHPFSPNSVETR